MGPVRIRHSSQNLGWQSSHSVDLAVWQSSHSVDLAGWQAKMESIATIRPVATGVWLE